MARSKDYQIVSDIWKNVLNTEELAETDSFFDRNGNSLQAVIMLEMVRQATGGAFTIQDIYTHETLGEFAALAEARSERPTLEVEGEADTFIEDTHIPLQSESVRKSFEIYNSNAQNPVEKQYRMLRFQKYFMNQSGADYLTVLSTKIHIRHAENVDQIITALRHLVKEQEALRTGRVGENTLAVFCAEPWNIPVLKKCELENDWNEVLEGLSQARNEEALFGEGKLLAKLLVLEYSEEEYEVRVYAHHGIWDRMSHLVVSERLAGILSGEREKPDGIMPYSRYVDSQRANPERILRFYAGFCRRILRPFCCYAAMIRRWRNYSVTVCWKPEKEYLQRFKDEPIQMNLELYAQWLERMTGYRGDVPFAVITGGRNHENANTLGMWLNTIPSVRYADRGNIVTYDGDTDFSGAAEKILAYEMVPIPLFRFLAHCLPIVNYVGMFPDYQEAGREYLKIVDLSAPETEIREVTALGENVLENRLTTFVSGDYIHCTMQVYADSEKTVRQTMREMLEIRV
ncbi:MAG: phosphopantetheine-binding protein [Lachnospiraceae bacterium]|nr:phosphopantetheine-binding protein [Lachnospiraceae bacterium]